MKMLLIYSVSCMVLTASAQKITYKNLPDSNLTYILNSIEKHIAFKNNKDDLFINVYVVSDPSGSAHTEGTDEITNTIYVAVSEDGEYPEQHLYKLTSVYDPKIVSWTKNAANPQLVFTCGAYGHRKRVVVSIFLKSLQIGQ
ncbi:MAG: hypothetical protein ACHQHN_19805 [Sphingobacteriales bacterium]